MLIEILLISGASIASIFTAKKILKRNNKKKTFHVKYAFGNRPNQTYTDLFSITTSDRECLENQLIQLSKLKFIKDVRKGEMPPSGICIHESVGNTFMSIANKETFYISVL